MFEHEASPNVFEFLPETDGIISAPPAGSHTVWGKLVCGASADTWQWDSTSVSWPDTMYFSQTSESFPETYGLEQSDTAQTFGTGSASSQSVSVSSSEDVWKIIAKRKIVGGGFDTFDPIGYLIVLKSSMDDSALQSRWLKVSADSSQNGIGVMFPDMPDGSYLKLVKMDPTPSTLSFTGWVGVDV